MPQRPAVFRVESDEIAASVGGEKQPAGRAEKPLGPTCRWNFPLDLAGLVIQSAQMIAGSHQTAFCGAVSLRSRRSVRQIVDAVGLFGAHVEQPCVRAI